MIESVPERFACAYYAGIRLDPTQFEGNWFESGAVESLISLSPAYTKLNSGRSDQEVTSQQSNALS